MKRRGRGRGVNATGRSERAERFWMLTFSMARSAVFRSLSGAALKVLVELRCRYDGSNAGRLHLSYREAERLLGLGRATIQRAYLELEQKGFVKQTRRGARFCRLASEWHTTDVALNADSQPTNDWRRWQPPPKANRGFRRGNKTGSLGSETEPCKPPCPARETMKAIFDPSNGSVLETHIHLTSGRANREAAD